MPNKTEYGWQRKRQEGEKMLKEQIDGLIDTYKRLGNPEKHSEITAIILNLFKAEVDKLTELTDSEVEAILEKGFDINIKPESQEHIQRIIQIQHTKKELLGLMGE